MQRPGQRRAQTRYIQMGILPGLFLFKHPTTFSVSSPSFPPSTSFRSSEIYNESITIRHQRRLLPKILTVSVTAALPIRSGVEGGRVLMRHASWDLRDVCDLPPICLKGSIYRCVLPQKTVARIRYWLTKSFNGFCSSADKCESRI